MKLIVIYIELEVHKNLRSIVSKVNILNFSSIVLYIPITKKYVQRSTRHQQHKKEEIFCRVVFDFDFSINRIFVKFVIYCILVSTKLQITQKVQIKLI